MSKRKRNCHIGFRLSEEEKELLMEKLEERGEKLQDLMLRCVIDYISEDDIATDIYKTINNRYPRIQCKVVVLNDKGVESNE